MHDSRIVETVQTITTVAFTYNLTVTNFGNVAHIYAVQGHRAQVLLL